LLLFLLLFQPKKTESLLAIGGFMAMRLQMFVLFFCLLFAAGTLMFDHGTFSAGTALGSLLTAGLIAAIIKPRK
jgi:hypothetical protein